MNYDYVFFHLSRCLTTFLLSGLSEIYFVCDNFDMLCNSKLRGDSLGEKKI